MPRWWRLPGCDARLSCAATPSTSGVLGLQPSSSAARPTSPAVMSTSPGSAGRSSIGTASPARDPTSPISSCNDVTDPPATLIGVAGGDVGRGGGDEGPHGVVDVGQVTPSAAAAEPREPLAPTHRLADAVHCHVRTLPGPVDREEAQQHRSHAPRIGVDAAEMLGRELGDAIGALRAGAVGLPARTCRRRQP